jgi:hypothetical protein
MNFRRGYYIIYFYLKQIRFRMCMPIHSSVKWKWLNLPRKKLSRNALDNNVFKKLSKELIFQRLIKFEVRLYIITYRSILFRNDMRDYFTCTPLSAGENVIHNSTDPCTEVACNVTTAIIVAPPSYHAGPQPRDVLSNSFTRFSRLNDCGLRTHPDNTKTF